jgi:hypothetical protein
MLQEEQSEDFIHQPKLISTLYLQKRPNLHNAAQWQAHCQTVALAKSKLHLTQKQSFPHCAHKRKTH